MNDIDGTTIPKRSRNQILEYDYLNSIKRRRKRERKNQKWKKIHIIHRLLFDVVVTKKMNERNKESKKIEVTGDEERRHIFELKK